MFSLFCLPFVGQLPVIAERNLGIDPRSAAYGLLYACFGVGAVIGALSIGTVFAAGLEAPPGPSAGGPVRRLPHGPRRGPGPVRSRSRPWSSSGSAYFATVTSLSTVLQQQLDDRVRGRVMALWIMGFGGTVPIGNLIAGPVIEATVVTAVMLVGAVMAALLGFYADLFTTRADGADGPATRPQASRRRSARRSRPATRLPLTRTASLGPRSASSPTAPSTASTTSTVGP